MKFPSNTFPKPFSQPASNSNFAKKTKTFERISPFELKPESLAETEKEDLYKHICGIKSTYSSYKQYFVEQRLYKPTELVDKFWEIAWFGYHLPLEQLAKFLIQKFGAHPSKLIQLMIQHRGMDAGKQLTSLTIVFDKFFWITSENDFAVAVGQKKVMGVIKPGWNLEKSRQMFMSADDQHKYHWTFKEEGLSESEQSDKSPDPVDSEEEMEDRPKKKHKTFDESEFISMLSEKIPSKLWIKELIQGTIQAESKLIKEEVFKSQLKVSQFMEQIKSMISENQAKEVKDQRKKNYNKKLETRGQTLHQGKVESTKLESLQGTPKAIKLEEGAEQK